MRVVWMRKQATVEEVRQALPKAKRGAYNTVQTILNRLSERGLLKRTRVGKAFAYEATISEAEYLAGSLSRTLTGASKEARRAALATLVGELDVSEVDEVRSLAAEVKRKRNSG